MISFLLTPRLFGGEFSLFALDSNFIPLGSSVHAHYSLAPGEWDDPLHDAPTAYFYLDYDNVGSVTMTNVGFDGTWGADYTYSSPEYAGTYCLGAEVPGTVDDSWDSEDATWAIIMGWSKGEVRPGVGKNETVLLYVDPSSACSSVTISTGGIVTASPGTPGSSPATVTVTGVTPSTIQYDDAVEASTPDGDAVFLPAVATVPTSFSENNVTTTNMTFNTNLFQVTWGPTNVTVQVTDQFGVNLGESWAGASVTEYQYLDGTFTSVFATGPLGALASDGTSLDPVSYTAGFSIHQADFWNLFYGGTATLHSLPNFYQKITVGGAWLDGNNTRSFSVDLNVLSVNNSIAY